MARHQKPPSQTWRTLLNNHLPDFASIDFFTIPTATFRVLYVFIVLRHDRRQIVHFKVTAHPTAQWTGQQIVEAFPFDTAPRYLLRDRDGIDGNTVQRRIKSLGIEEVLTAPRSPWQNPFAERKIGSIRRDYSDHVIMFNERHLRQILRQYLGYYHTCRPHLSLDKDSPMPRAIQPAHLGETVAFFFGWPTSLLRTVSGVETLCSRIAKDRIRLSFLDGQDSRSDRSKESARSIIRSWTCPPERHSWGTTHTGPIPANPLSRQAYTLPID